MPFYNVVLSFGSVFVDWDLMILSRHVSSALLLMQRYTVQKCAVTSTVVDAAFDVRKHAHQLHHSNVIVSLQ